MRILEMTNLPFPIFYLGMTRFYPQPADSGTSSPCELIVADAAWRNPRRDRAPRPPGASPTVGIERCGRWEQAILLESSTTARLSEHRMEGCGQADILNLLVVASPALMVAPSCASLASPLGPRSGLAALLPELLVDKQLP